MQAIINIPQPCSENWDAMQPDAQGRHCSSCAKTVIDFTSWELQDIAAYLKKKTGKHVCGRFLNSQLNQPFDLTALAPKVISWHTNEWRKIAALIIVCFALASCSMGKATDSNQDTEQAMSTTGVVLATPIQDSITDESKKPTPIATAKRRTNKSPKQPIGYVEAHEGHTMGLPELEEPQYVPTKDSVKYQPLIGPPEDTLSEIK
ncbi:MAG: hypothetical protein WC756_10070 [Taibaiella sp.]|jgi:hypothetical protein